MVYIQTLMIIILILPFGYGKNLVREKIDRATGKLENPFYSKREAFVSNGASEINSTRKSRDKNIGYAKHRSFYSFPRNEVILSISKTKAYDGDQVIITAYEHCMNNASMYECGGRAPEMNFYQDDVKIANLYIGFADLKCHLRNLNGTQHECSTEECNCFRPDPYLYVFHYYFKASPEQNGASFIAISRWNLTSNKVHLYVPVSGAVFTRWGNNSCGSIYNDRIFPGYSNYLFHNNSPLRQVCFPETTSMTGLSIFGRKKKRSLRSQNALVSPNTDPCAVCRSHRAVSVVMVPGRSNCNDNMNFEYNGYLIPSGNDVLCLDRARMAKINTTRFVNVMKTGCHDNGHCGTSLDTGPIECVVCSI